MKKLLFLLPAAALALASCSSDEIVEQPASKALATNALQIYPEMQSATRGTVYDNSNFTKFKLTTSASFQTDGVHADAEAVTPTTENPGNVVQKFDATDVVKENGKWKIGDYTDWYWRNKSASSSFTAWAPVDPSKYTASTTDLSALEDIVVAYNTGSATEFEAGVPLKFRHILSQIVIKADNSATSKIQIKVKGIRLNNLATTRTWTLPEAKTVDALPAEVWTDDPSGTGDYVATYESAIKTLTGSAQEITGNDPLLLIPQQLGAAKIDEGTGQYLSVLVQIVDLNPEGADDDAKKVAAAVFPKIANATDTQHFAWAAVDINTNWLPGKKYIYTLHFTENGYGKVDKDQTGGGEGDGTGNTDPKPGDEVVDTPVKLILDVDVVDWENGFDPKASEEHDM